MMAIHTCVFRYRRMRHTADTQIAGSYALYIGTYFGLKLKSFVRSLTHAEHFSLANPLPGARLKRGITKLYRAVFNSTILFAVHPIARGLVWEMRLGMLIRHGLTEGRNVLHLWDMWYVVFPFDPRVTPGTYGCCD